MAYVYFQRLVSVPQIAPRYRRRNGAKGRRNGRVKWDRAQLPKFSGAPVFVYFRRVIILD